MVAWICLVGFAALYLFGDVDLPLARCRASRTGVQLLPLAALFAMGIALALVFRGGWTGLLVYCGVAAGWTLRWRFLVPVLFALGVFMVVSGALLGYRWADLGFITFLTVALGFTMLAFRRLDRNRHRAAHRARRGRPAGGRR